MERGRFSDQLESWLKSDEPKTVGRLGEVFGEKSFAVTVVLLMFVPAVPAPTGGITHVFELITVIIGAEMVIGARTMWLPSRWRERELGDTLTTKAIPFIARTIRWFERLSQPLTHPYVLTRGWQPGRVWTDADEVQTSREAMARLISGLLLRCRERIYLGIAELGESGFEGRGELLRAFQKVLQESSGSA